MPIYARVFLPFVLALSIGSLLAWWLAATLLEDSLTRRIEDQLERAVAELASGRLPLSPELLDRLGALLGAELVLIPAAGAPDGPLANAALGTLAQSPAGGSGRFRSADTVNGLVVRPVAAGLDPRYRALAAGSALTEVERISRRAALLLAVAAAAGTLLLAWIAHRTARAITRPLAAIGALAERLSTGDLQARARVEGPPSWSPWARPSSAWRTDWGATRRRSPTATGCPRWASWRPGSPTRSATR